MTPYTSQTHTHTHTQTRTHTHIRAHTRTYAHTHRQTNQQTVRVTFDFDVEKSWPKIPLRYVWSLKQSSDTYFTPLLYLIYLQYYLFVIVMA